MSLVAGRAQVCTDAASGGVVRIAFANRPDVTDITVTAVTDVITAITMASTKIFYAYAHLKETLRWTEKGTLTNNTELYEGEIRGFWTGFSPADRTAIRNMFKASRCGMVAIFELESGGTVLAGINVDKKTATEKYFVELAEETIDSGAAISDPNQREVIFRYRSSAPAAPFSPGWAGVPLT